LAGARTRLAKRPLGETPRRIVHVARTVLMSRGYAQFSMRNVAAAAGMRLANVQYYFPTRNDLVHALMRDTQERYAAAYGECLIKAPPDRRERFKAFMDFSLADVANPDTRRFITQMWRCSTLSTRIPATCSTSSTRWTSPRSASA
jgi:AcrR family transcriptional regulator